MLFQEHAVKSKILMEFVKSQMATVAILVRFGLSVTNF